MEMTQHLKPLYIKATFDGVPIIHVLIDNDATVNILLMKIVRKLGKSEKYLIDTEILVTRFDGNKAHAKGVIPVTLWVGSSSSIASFFVVNGTLSYNALRGRD
ncbi:hypothetical protein CFOL_v3_09997 [Cephalotus follicularis]|uniref:Uncharacterized protein n=1 Tax=Cephalotus follicularis TaxID=3775 RepID=A0A1Q3BEN1_CEPFO|nr:hypothetical protein CFOL_v3_09997 [Cephalotus follicularis]